MKSCQNFSAEAIRECGFSLLPSDGMKAVLVQIADLSPAYPRAPHNSTQTAAVSLWKMNDVVADTRVDQGLATDLPTSPRGEPVPSLHLREEIERLKNAPRATGCSHVVLPDGPELIGVDP